LVDGDGHGVPVWHFPPDKRDLAIRFATDPAYRQHCANCKKVKYDGCRLIVH
jgi:hypothetical protein